MDLLLSITLFILVGTLMVSAPLIAGSLLRPKLPNPDKLATYECGEPAIGPSWIQFDLRYYNVALVYLVFDVEVALLYPWAVAWGSAGSPEIAQKLSVFEFRTVAFVDLVVFFGIVLVGFAYLWRFGYLDWVRSAATTSLKLDHPPKPR